MKTAYWIVPALATMALAACQQPEVSDVTVTENTIQIDGSSTVYPISKEAAQRYVRKNKDASIQVKFSGTGAGFALFCEGKTDINDASRRINDKEKALCAQNGIAYDELPLAVDTIAIVINPKNEWVDKLTVAELNTIWAPESEGKVKTWADVRQGFPAEPLKLYGRAENSGTFDYFSEAINHTAGHIRKDYDASQDEEYLSAEIAKNKGALGFFGIGAYHRHWQALRLVPVDSGQGPISPSLQTAADGSYTPLTRPLYLYVNQASLQQKSDLKPFLQDYYGNLRTWLHFTGYMPASEAQYMSVKTLLQ